MAKDNQNNTNNNKEAAPDITVNAKVIFHSGRVAELLRKLEKFLGIPLSLRSTSGEVVCKTDYFYGPCSYIRGTDIGCSRCRKVYSNIGKKIIMRKVPYACLCYCGFLIFAVPLEFRGEMVGILMGSQVLPISDSNNVDDFKEKFKRSSKEIGLNNNKEFLDSFVKIKTLDDNRQRLKFLSYLEAVGRHFVDMAAEGKTWNAFMREIKASSPKFGDF